MSFNPVSVMAQKPGYGGILTAIGLLGKLRMKYPEYPRPRPQIPY